MADLNSHTLLWFKTNLREHDNLMIHWAQTQRRPVVGLVTLPENVGVHRRCFYLQSALELQKKFQKSQIPFFILDPADSLKSTVKRMSEMIRDFQIKTVVSEKAFNFRDQQMIKDLSKAQSELQIVELEDQTLIPLSGLPYKVEDLPFVFTTFRKKIEAHLDVNPPLTSSVNQLIPIKNIPHIEIKDPSLYEEEKKCIFPFDIQPTETAALQRLHQYFSQPEVVHCYKETRNGMLFRDESTKFSVHLAVGTLSVRMIYASLKEFERAFSANESTVWILQELLWREYFKYLALKIGSSLFKPNGISLKSKSWRRDPADYTNWQQGQTGQDFIDAHMTELAETGWMSNRGRQNVASYLAKHLEIDWTLGAQYFEKQLIDYDTESNWGNWLYVSGMGTDPRDRRFDPVRQSEMYDADFSYRNKWFSLKK